MFSVLQCVAVCCRECVAPAIENSNVYIEVCCSVLQYIAECCSVLLCVAVCCSQRAAPEIESSNVSAQVQIIEKSDVL